MDAGGAVICGIGTDICDVRRIAGVLTRQGDRFAQKILGPQEWRVFQARRAQSLSRGQRYLAARFAAKEAFAKAIGLGLRAPMNWLSCEVIHGDAGQPVIQLHGALAAWFAAQGWRAHVSLSDELEHAVAFVLVETDVRGDAVNGVESRKAGLI